MTFSICVPVYNVEKYIRNCIDSVLNQTFNDFELILVDDGSTDSSGLICEEYKKKDCRISVYHNQNHGLFYSRRFAIEKATGQYLVYLDSDDTLDVNALLTIFECFSSDEVDCIIYGFQRIQNETIISVTNDNKQEILEDKNRIFKRILFNTDYNSLWRKSVKTELVKDIDYSRLYHIDKGEDLVQTLDIVNRCRRIMFIPEVLYNYSINPKGIIQSSTQYSNYSINFEVAEIELYFLENQNLFSNEDWIEYRTNKVYGLVQELKKICKFKTDMTTRFDLFDSIVESHYYQSFLYNKVINKSSLKHNYFFYNLFVNRHYFLLILVTNIVNFSIRKFRKAVNNH